MPESVWVPAPIFVRESGAVPLTMLPLKSPDPPPPPVVRIAAPRLFWTTPPAVPLNDPTVLSRPPRSRLPPLLTVTAEFTPKACVEPASNLPPFTVVAPV